MVFEKCLYGYVSVCVCVCVCVGVCVCEYTPESQLLLGRY